ncbi:uncharacterized protein BX664DRAFT_339715 [Halteromyces radiatus]|uniref:uncharacterized protein n=1 Tax=Halteromyces radiatus TaxID=101107 RepID=UPI00221FC357|nr:uncharacterized protein BX664DRAFT_339715 [Halteromyces radiatus]KAI8083055.1 hypothetical protein BX664DRAFT_339715 [Halteromyces radiatus]
MKKNFGKFKQWTGERLGAVKATSQTDDFQQLEAETENKRTGFEKVYEATDQFYTQLSKKKPSPEDQKIKCTPLESLASCWMHHGTAFSEDVALGVALINLGQTEARIALLQEDFANMIKDGYMDVLEQGLQTYKDYHALKKKLESRRLDYDAKLSRLQKSKKEKPEWEQEMQAAKMKYEETEYDIIQKMLTLQSYEDDHWNALYQVMEAQLSYHQQAMDMLNELRTHMPTPINSQSTRPTMTPISRSSTTSSAISSLTSTSALTPTNGHGNTDDYFGTSTLKSTQRFSGSRQPSLDNLHRPRRAPSHSSVTSYSNDDQSQQQQLSTSPCRLPPPMMPRRKSSAGIKKLRKAIYDFQGESSDELSFRIGDIITVVEPVDEGWWMGEMDDLGSKRRGIFPVNYTEDMMQTTTSPPTMPIRPMMTTHIQEEPQDEDLSQQVTDQSPFSDNSSSNTTGFSYIRPNPISRSSSTSISSIASSGTVTPSLARSSTVITNQSKLALSNRTPPPPPPALSRSNTPSVKSISSSTRTPPPPPPSRNLGTSSGPTTMQVANCQDCGCDDFSANLFKKGHCNNCFHKHIVC